jgi:putative transposase
MTIKAIYRHPTASKPAAGNKTHPYLLSDIVVTRPNQVWAADITYIPMARGFLYLAAIMDVYSRYLLSWRLSNSLDATFCVEALLEALAKGQPDIFNTEPKSAWMRKGAIMTTSS